MHRRVCHFAEDVHRSQNTRCSGSACLLTYCLGSPPLTTNPSTPFQIVKLFTKLLQETSQPRGGALPDWFVSSSCVPPHHTLPVRWSLVLRLRQILIVGPDQALPENAGEILVEQLTIKGVILQYLVKSGYGYHRDN